MTIHRYFMLKTESAELEPFLKNILQKYNNRKMYDWVVIMTGSNYQ